MNFPDIIVNIAPILKGKDLIYFTLVNKMYHDIGTVLIKNKSTLENIEELMHISGVNYKATMKKSVNVEQFFDLKTDNTYTVSKSNFQHSVVIKYNKLSIRLHKNGNAVLYGRYCRNINIYLDTLFKTKDCLDISKIRLINVTFRIPPITQEFMDQYYPEANYVKNHYVVKLQGMITCLIYNNGNVMLACKDIETCLQFYKTLNIQYNEYYKYTTLIY